MNTFGALQSDNALNSPLLNRLQTLALKTVHVECSSHRDEAMSTGASDAVAPSSSGEDSDPLSGGTRSVIALDAHGSATIKEFDAVGLSAIHRGLELDHTIVFHWKGNTRKYVAQHGQGDFFAMVKREELLNATVRDVFSVCLRRGEDGLIQNPADPKIQSFIPDWLRPLASSHPMI